MAYSSGPLFYTHSNQYFSPINTMNEPPRSYSRHPPTPGGSPTSNGGGGSSTPPYMASGQYSNGYQYGNLSSSSNSHMVHPRGASGFNGSNSMGSYQASGTPTSFTAHRPTISTMSGADNAFVDQYMNLSTWPEAAPSVGLPSWQETEEYLRKTLGIQHPLPLDLTSLSEEPQGAKHPKISELIKLAIWGSRDKRLTLRQIYEAIEHRYPAYKEQKDKPWQRSIRHNLSLKAMFVRVERPSNHPGKGYYWMLDVSQGDGNKRDRKRREGARGGRGLKEEDSSEEFDVSDASSEAGQQTHSSMSPAQYSRGGHPSTSQFPQGPLGGSSLPPMNGVHHLHNNAQFSSQNMGYPANMSPGYNQMNPMSAQAGAMNGSPTDVYGNSRMHGGSLHHSSQASYNHAMPQQQQMAQAISPSALHGSSSRSARRAYESNPEDQMEEDERAAPRQRSSRHYNN